MTRPHPRPGGRRAGALATARATPVPCPDGGVLTYARRVATASLEAACETSTSPSRNGFYGYGIVDALAAVTERGGDFIGREREQLSPAVAAPASTSATSPRPVETLTSASLSTE